VIHHGTLFLLIFLAVGVGLKGPLLLMRLMSKRRASLNPALDLEDEIKAVDCNYCGYHVEGVDEQELFDQLHIHVDQAHSELRLTDEQISKIIASDVYEAGRQRPSQN